MTWTRLEDGRRPVRVIAAAVALLAAAFAIAAALAPPASAQDDGGPKQVVIAENIDDFTQKSRSGTQVASFSGDFFNSENLAIAASAGCNRCDSVAVAVQAVLVGSTPSVFTPRNAATAATGGCTHCVSYAYASQYIVPAGTPVRLSEDGRDRVRRIRHRIADVAETPIPNEPDQALLTLQAMTADLDALVARLRSVIDAELLEAGIPSTSSPEESVSGEIDGTAVPAG